MTHKIVEVISVKPEGTPWFSDAHPVEFIEYTKWLKTFEGLVFLAREDPNPNTISRTYVFEDEAAYENYITAHRENIYGRMKLKYNNTNGIVNTVNFLNE